MIREAIRIVVEGTHLSREQAAAAMDAIMSGEATGAQIGCLLTALRLKGETTDEITGFAATMRDKVTPIRLPQAVSNGHRAHAVIDTCGTGGDGLHTFNISTVAALVAAGAGATVAKHGNRSVSSKCGSADVLKALGVNIEAPVETVERCLSEIGIAFLFAPMLHTAMKHAIGPRREIGIRTVFNILGPLTNPAGATAQLLGVYDGRLCETLAAVLRSLGSERAFVAHGKDGQDEISLTGPTHVAELRNGHIESYIIEPELFGLKRVRTQDLAGGEPDENARIAREVLDGKRGPHFDAVVLNAGAAIAAAGLTGDIADGIMAATDAITSGAARAKLDVLVKLTNE
ncbi:MAG: anthranilate phosphoribosyltransferase [Verrucomicrobia bacterium]|nr:anthranilate phosphoribosyltransferase [Verrucomicrobiota bacterium]